LVLLQLLLLLGVFLRELLGLLLVLLLQRLLFGFIRRLLREALVILLLFRLECLALLDLLHLKLISAAATSRNAIFKEAKLRSIESNRNMEIIDNSRDATYCCAS
jgi:hypothetical protein